MKKRPLKSRLLIFSSLLVIALIWFFIVSVKQYELYELKRNIVDGNISKVEQLIQDHPKSLFYQDEYGQPIHTAVTTGNIPMIELLIRHGASINALTPKGLSPLYFAIFYNQPEVVKFLMEHRVDTHSGIKGFSPLGCAVTVGNVQVIRVLLHYRELLNQPGSFGDQPLSNAVYGEDPMIVKMLLDEGANVNASDKYHATALHLAIKKNEVDCVNLLLAKGAKINTMANHGITPLHVACAYNRVYIAKILIFHGADPRLKNEKGRTPLDIAKEKNYPTMVKLLESYQGGNSEIVTQHL